MQNVHQIRYKKNPPIVYLKGCMKNGYEHRYIRKYHHMQVDLMGADEFFNAFVCPKKQLNKYFHRIIIWGILRFFFRYNSSIGVFLPIYYVT